MDLRLIIFTGLLISGLSFWFYINTKLTIDYRRHQQLIDETTGKKIKPSDILDLYKLVNHSTDYIESTNAQERYRELIYQSNLENPFMIDQRYSDREDLIKSGWPVANEQVCSQQLDWIIGQYNSNTNFTYLKGQLGYELTTLIDSFGKPASGSYTNIASWIGSYSQCLNVKLRSGSINTRYCIGRARFKWWPKDERIYPSTSIRFGLCLPETCDTLAFQTQKSKIVALAKLELPQIYKDGLEFDSMFCLPDERSPIRAMPTSGRVFITITCSWIAIVLATSAVYEYSKRKRTNERPLETDNIKSVKIADFDQPDKPDLKSKLIEALSIRCSLKSFKSNEFKIRYKNGDRVRVDLGLLDFFKTIMAILVVLGHSGYLMLTYMKTLNDKMYLGTGELGSLALSVSRCVDTFFLFFGLLTTYTMMRKFSTKQLSNPLIWIGINLGVLLRISPVFLLVYWYSHSVSPYTGSGPWWDYGVDEFSMKGVCMRDSWWKSIPYFGSLSNPPVPACVLPSWFIVCYSQISTLLPIITYILCALKNHLSRYLLTTFILLASAVNVGFRLYNQTSVKEEAFTLYGGFLTDLMEKFESLGHITTFGRLGCVTVGCFVGYLLRIYDQGKILEWPRWMRSRLLVTVAVLGHIIIVFLPIIGRRVFEITGRLASLDEFVVFNVVIMILWPILNSLLVLVGTTIYNHMVVARFMSHTFWHVFNRLGLCIFLVHWELIFIAITSGDQGHYGTVNDVMRLWAYGVYVSIVLAFVIHILIETPLSNLLTLLGKTIMLKIQSPVELNLEQASDQDSKLTSIVYN